MCILAENETLTEQGQMEEYLVCRYSTKNVISLVLITERHLEGILPECLQSPC